MTNVTKFLRTGMTTFITLLMVEWLSKIESMQYMKARFTHIMKRMSDPSDPLACEGLTFSATFSMVPFDGGQYFTATFSYLVRSMETQHVDCAWFQCCDTDNGDDVELPPNGIISPAALPRALDCIKHVLTLTRGYLTLTSITAGQGLTEHCGAITTAAGLVYPPGSFFVMPSMSTHASELAAGLVH
jgi:hypothetical protein